MTMPRAAPLLGALGLAVATACGGCSAPEGAPPKSAETAEAGEGPGAFFVRKGCTSCHEVSSFGLPSRTKVGPDLAFAVEDVPRRFGTTLEGFLERPQGTMAIVLATRISLDARERAEAIRLLRSAHEARIRKPESTGLAASHGAASASRTEGAVP